MSSDVVLTSNASQQYSNMMYNRSPPASPIKMNPPTVSDTAPNKLTRNPTDPLINKSSTIEQQQKQIFSSILTTKFSDDKTKKNETLGTPSRKISASLFKYPFMTFLEQKEQIPDTDNSLNPMPGCADGAGTTGLTTGGCHHNNNSRNVQQEQDTFPEIKGRVESKLMSMWQNVKYGWGGKIRTNFSKEQPVWLLGKCYHRKYSPCSSMESSAELTVSLENKLLINDQQTQQQQQQQESQIDELLDPTIQELGTDATEGADLIENPWEEGIEGFKRDFQSRLWMTYRREFPSMNGSNYTSDCGWGCMLRSGQMLLAQGMICHFLGRNWRWNPETQIHSTYEDNMHRKIIRWFGDSSSKNSPFSIHTLVTLGMETGKKPGDWYGPLAVSHLLRESVKLASQENVDFDDLVVYVAQDCTVFIQDILDECLVPDPKTVPIAPWQHRKKSVEKYNCEDKHWKSLIILVPLRLGAEKLNQIYGNSLKTLLSTEYCIGIIGGRPKHALYFVGFQEDKLIHLDPHYCQEMVDVNQENFPVQTFHCKSPRKLKLSKLDPCCSIGFYCQTKTEFDNFVASVQPYLLPVKSPQHNSYQTTDRTTSTSGYSNLNTSVVDYPMFVFSKSKYSEQKQSAFVYTPTKNLNTIPHTSPIDTEIETDDDETEEFVIL